MSETPPNPPRRSLFAVWRWPWWVLLAAVIFTTLLAYQGAYFAIVDEALGATIEFNTFEVHPVPDYSCDNRIPAAWSRGLTRFFGPAHYLDRSIRREKWLPLLHKLTPEEFESGVVEFQLKPEWKRHLPPDQQSLDISMTLPDRPAATRATDPSK